MDRPETDQPERPERRGFIKKILAVVIGGITTLFPAVAGLAVFFDPLRRKSSARDAIQVASLNALPEDGIPRKFAVITSHSDAWNKSPQVPIGAVYLRRTGENSVQAFNVVCPHLGCFVDFVPSKKTYLCPCHGSAFGLDGNIVDRRTSPSPRGLDELEVELRDGQVWVKFQNFRTSEAKKIPIS